MQEPGQRWLGSCIYGPGRLQPLNPGRRDSASERARDEGAATDERALSSGSVTYQNVGRRAKGVCRIVVGLSQNHKSSGERHAPISAYAMLRTGPFAIKAIDSCIQTSNHPSELMGPNVFHG